MIRGAISLCAAFMGMLLFNGAHLQAQEPVTQFQMFGHLTSTAEIIENDWQSDFSLGEHDFFVVSKITPRISFLSETVVAPTGGMGHSSSGFKVSIERARLKYQHREWLSIIVGKMHTPVNYWNDVYHHGRLFFPTIDRPRSFGTAIPIHSLGLRLQGQNIGGINLGYDLVIGNGMSSTDISDGSLQKSLTAAVHIKPKEGMRIGLSAYRDLIKENSTGSHSGHSSTFHYTMGDANWYPVDLNFELYCFSFYRNRGKWETLLETTWNRNSLSDTNDPDLVSVLDSLGRSDNTTFYAYAGRKVSKLDRIYGLLDISNVSEADLHLKSNKLTKFGFGWSHDFSALVRSQVQFERYTGLAGYEVPADDKWEIKLRIAYCLY